MKTLRADDSVGFPCESRSLSGFLSLKPRVAMQVGVFFIPNMSYMSYQFPGGNSEREPPDPISNSEVKTLRADDSVGFPCESRSLSGFLSLKPQFAMQVGVFFYLLTYLFPQDSILSCFSPINFIKFRQAPWTLRPDLKKRLNLY